MKLLRNIAWTISVGLAVVLLNACGGGGSDDTDTTGTTQQENNTSGGDTQTNGNTSDGNTSTGNTSALTATYVASNGVLIETRSDNSKRAWVNTSSDGFCKVSRSETRSGTAQEDGIAHCQMLANQNYEGINTWRLPTIEEAKLIMNRDNLAVLIFPSSNPDCAIMMTNTVNSFVYTTSNWNSAEDVGTEFVDPARNDKTAGIRCVANQ